MSSSHRFTARLVSVVASVLFLCAFVLPGRSTRIRHVTTQPETRIDPQQLEKIARQLDSLIRHEMAEKNLSALSIALVDNQNIIWKRDYGFADPSTKSPADSNTMYRVGSISKLFTDIAVMQLVERGEVALDSPIVRYLPDFHPSGDGAAQITVRSLMSHRAGVVREPPVGHYFDDTSPTIAATISSMNRTELVYPPFSRTKYSNAGVSVVGRMLEVLKNRPFNEYLATAVLQPLGITDCSFGPTTGIIATLAKGYMWGWDGFTLDAPHFELGTAPAGNMYCTTTGLSTFLSALFNDGAGKNGRLLSRDALQEMWKPQFSRPGSRSAFGLGFQLDSLDGMLEIHHGGAVYGFSSEVAGLPAAKVGSVVITSKDDANGITRHIANEALRLLAAAVNRTTLPEARTSDRLADTLAKAIAGEYKGRSETWTFVARDSLVYGFRSSGGARRTLRRLNRDTLIADDESAFGPKVTVSGNRMIYGADTLVRQSPMSRPSPAPSAFNDLIGEYGWPYDKLYVYEQGGQLQALIEWHTSYPLRQISATEFAFPDAGLYSGEHVRFVRNALGRAARVFVSGVEFPRLAIPGEDGSTFRIVPMRPIPELRSEALAASPPIETGEFRQTDLVELIKLDPTIKLDIRYASTNNFISTPVYEQARAFMQRPAAESLVRAHRALKKLGYGLLIHDAYRPWYATRIFWDATPESGKIFVANPAQGSRHNRGCAVDLTLYDLRSGAPVQMVGGYDEQSERSFPDYLGGTSLQRWHRDLLRHSMENEGFHVYEFEWWHFDCRDWRQYRIQNIPFGKM